MKFRFVNFMRFTKKRANCTVRVACFVLCAVFAAGFAGCEQPNLKKTRGVGGDEQNPELDSNELENYIRAVIDDKGDQLAKIAPTSSIPLAPAYSARGNKDATELIIQPQPKSEGATVVVKIDGELWGTYKKPEWTWHTPPTLETDDGPGDTDTGTGTDTGTDTEGTDELGTSESEAEPARTNRIPFGSTCIIEMTVSGATNPIKRVYTYTVSPYVRADDGSATQQDLVSGRVTGDFTRSFLGTIYTGPDGLLYVLREVQAVNTSGDIVGSTTMQNGVMSGRYFQLPIMGQNSSVLSGVKFRAVFTKTNLAPHYSYPPVALKEFAASAAEATADKPFEHYIFPEEVSYGRAAAHATNTGKWMVNGMDFEVPEQGTITSVTVDAAVAATDIKIGLFRNARVGSQAMKLSEITVTTTDGGAADPQNTFQVNNWEVLKGDKIGVLTTANGSVYTNLRTNTNTAILVDANGACTAPTNLAAVGVGYTFKPLVNAEKNSQFMELPVTNAVIPVGGKDSFLGKNAETTLREIGVGSSVFSLKANYMLMQDVSLSQGEWLPVGRQGQNGVFSGRFYGNGHTISNLKLKRADVISGENLIGFLGYMYGRIEYIAGMYDVNFVVDTSGYLSSGSTAFTYLGMAAGRAEKTELKNIHVRGADPNQPLKIKHEGTGVQGIRAGGVAGLFYPNQIGLMTATECSNSLDIVLTYDRFWHANDDNSALGGVFGFVGNGNIANQTGGFVQDCYNDGNLTVYFTGGYLATAANAARHSISVGGITGRTGGQYNYIENCYSTGKILVLHGTRNADDEPNDDGHGASLLGGIVAYDSSNTGVSNATNTVAHVKYNYAAGSIAQKGRVSRTGNPFNAGANFNYASDTSFVGGVAGWNNYNHAAFNAIFMPNIRYPSSGTSNRQRVSPNMAAIAQINNAYGAIVIDLYTSDVNNINVAPGTPADSGRPAGVLNPAGANNIKAHGVSTDFADFMNKAKYEELGWRFDTSPEVPADGGPVIPGKHWHWKMAGGAAYPFPLLWWQAKHIGATSGNSPDTGAKYQWWETTLPAIDETWPANTPHNPGGYSLSIPHQFPEDLQ